MSPPTPDGEIAGGRAPGPAADRRVQHVDAAGGGLLVDAADERGGAGAEVEVDLALAQALEDAVLAQAHGLDLGGAGQGGEHDFRRLGDFAGGVGPVRAGFQVPGGGLTPDVVHHHFVAAL